jgi:hypothetical protein
MKLEPIPGNGKRLEKVADAEVSGVAMGAPDTSIRVGKWVNITTYFQLAAAYQVGIKELRSDLDRVPAGDPLREKGAQWLELAGAWEAYAAGHPDTHLGSFDSSEGRRLLAEWTALRDEIRKRKQAENEEKARRIRRAAEQAAREFEALKPKLERARANSMREAFRHDKSEALEEVVGWTGQILDIDLGLHHFGRQVSEVVAKQLEVELPKAAETVDAFEMLSHGLAIVTAALAITGEPKTTQIEEGVRSVGVATELFGSVAAFAGENLAPHIGIYVNAYLIPMTKAILKQLEILVEQLHDINKEWVELQGEPFYYPAEPGTNPLQLWRYMVEVMQARVPEELGDPPSDERLFVDKRELLEIGTGEEVPTIRWPRRALDPLKIKGWLFKHRAAVWAMLYGSMVAPERRGWRRAPGVMETPG